MADEDLRGRRKKQNRKRQVRNRHLEGPTARFDVRLFDRVDNHGQKEHAGEPMQQADRVAGPIYFVANEFEPFAADRLGLEARLDREPLRDPRYRLWWRPDSQQIS